ncbi:MAG: hypothetical protein HFP76_01820 [Methylococcales symbiont of Iophon sp. n. MRB-2018]|nr:MAG: hypothetical protein HFP76_01820 [Methylococcales symbiont of Iophon sp. n. MRB-2018]
MNPPQNIFLCISTCLILFSANISAEEAINNKLAESSSMESEMTISQDDVNALNSMSDPKSIQSSSDSMDDWFDTIPQQFNFQDYGEYKGKFFVNASQAVSLKPTDPQYGDALVNAFDKAMMKLQEKYLMHRFGKITTEKIKSFYSDRSTYAKDIALPSSTEPGYLNTVLAIFKKGLDVTEKKLDQELVELGVSPQELTQLSPKKKKDIFRDKFVKNTIRKASGSIAGLFPIQTNVITDEKGQTVVGVVAIASQKTIQIAKDIRLQRQTVITGKGKIITSLLPNNKKQFLSTLGVRLTYDIDGTPAIISYGIASYQSDTGDDYINDELKEEAKAEAISNADAQIAEIINGRMSAKEERKRGEEIKTFVEREMKPDSDTIEKTIKNIIKITNRNVKSSARAKLQGISTIKAWRHTVESGQKFVGAVRVWKYSTLASINDFNNPQRRTKKATKKNGSYSTFQQSSEPVNTMDDF